MVPSRFSMMSLIFCLLLYNSYINALAMEEHTQNVSSAATSTTPSSTSANELNQTSSAVTLEANSTHCCEKTASKSAENDTTVSVKSVTPSEAANETTSASTVSGSSTIVQATTTEVLTKVNVVEAKTTTAKVGGSTSAHVNECTVREGLFWWRKVKILVEQGRFNAKRCELQYCTPNLEIEPFTCKNLMSMIVPPASTEDLINEWKLECVKNQCIPED